eukprot:GDKI01038107.1.p1 GENE.GDKI01038107.1~~GDKI01038107.1.p1  ORF type:complete len:110 (+),score=4.93 GDKI01038107.1:141-470(+)
MHTKRTMKAVKCCEQNLITRSCEQWLHGHVHAVKQMASHVPLSSCAAQQSAQQSTIKPRPINTSSIMQSSIQPRGSGGVALSDLPLNVVKVHLLRGQGGTASRAAVVSL